MRQDNTLFLYELVKGYSLNVGKIIEESILDYQENKFSGNIPHPFLITLLCVKGGVKFSKEEEERCQKASPLTLAGVIKALVESEGREKRKKTRKRKRAKLELPKDQAPTVFLVESDNSEGGRYEGHSE